MSTLKYESGYDENGNDTLKIIYHWKDSKNQWINSSKNTWTYSQYGKITNSTTFNWNTSQNQWINSYKIDYSFDTHENEILRIESEWNTTTNLWNTKDKIEFDRFYNAKELQDSLIVHARNGASKEEYAYDRDGNNTINIHYNWNSITKDWVVWNTYNYYYSLHALTNSVDIIDNQQVRLYPNPAHEWVTLEIINRSVTHCELYNSNGQMLKILPVERGINTYNISHLKEGIYLIKMQSKEGTTIKKIIKN